MPATGQELKVGDITRVENKVNAGVKYIRFTIDHYFKDEPMDRLNKGLFAFASYNGARPDVRRRSEVASTDMPPLRGSKLQSRRQRLRGLS